MDQENIRWKEFWAEFDIANSFYNIADHLTEHTLFCVYGYEGAEEAADAGYSKVGLIRDSNDGLHNAKEEEFEKLPLYHFLAALKAYAEYGLIYHKGLRQISDHFMFATDTDAKLISGSMELLLSWFGPDQSCFPKYVHEMELTVKAARARLAIDVGKKNQRIEPSDLSALTGISLRGIQNLMLSPNKLHVKDGKGITVDVARKWLKKPRKGFRPSILNTLDDKPTSSSGEYSYEVYENVHFVPIEKTGEYFSPAHRRDGKYIVGPKNNEEEFDDYVSALEKLNHMEVPVWRRPTENSRWTTAKGVDWVRKTSLELGLT